MPAAKPKTEELFAELRKPFHPSEVKQRDGGFGKKLDYVDWTAVVRRLNDVVAEGWNTMVIRDSIVTTDRKNKKGQTEFLATVSLQLDILGASRMGTGADIDADPDKAVKTAQAEALKKAANQFGIALELWDAEVRDQIQKYRDLDGMGLVELKLALKERWTTETGDSESKGGGPQEIADHFKIEVEDLQKPHVLREILRS